MKIYWSKCPFFAFLFFLTTFSGLTLAREQKLPMPEVTEDGVYSQPWFFESLLDLRDDLAESQNSGKYLVILWEQRGCPYCKETHVVNLRIPKVVNYIKKHFNMIQLNLWGDREVVDFDGEITTEKKLARKYRIQFTPTMQFFSKAQGAATKSSLKDSEVWRIMGYWKPFHFMNTFVYVQENGYIEQPNFQRWLQMHAEKLREKGIEFNLW